MGCLKLHIEPLPTLRVIHSKKEQKPIKKMGSYYPFGLKHKGYNDNPNGTDHPYGYNGSEETNELGINILEMDMRQYDPAIARWTAMDPVTHYSLSPYNAFDNNPVFYADPSGADSQRSLSDPGYGTRMIGSSSEVDNFGLISGKFKNKTDDDESRDPPNEFQKFFRATAKRIERDFGTPSQIPEHSNDPFTKFLFGALDFMDNFEKGILQNFEDKYKFIKNPFQTMATSAMDMVNSGKSFMRDFVVSGETSLSSFVSSRAYNTVSNMTAGDWGYALGYATPDIATGFLSSYSSSVLRVPNFFRGYGLSAFNGRFQALYVNPNAKGITIFAIQNKNRFKNSTWHFRLDLHRVYSLGNRRVLHYHSGLRNGMSNRQWYRYIENNATPLIKF